MVKFRTGDAIQLPPRRPRDTIYPRLLRKLREITGAATCAHPGERAFRGSVYGRGREWFSVRAGVCTLVRSMDKTTFFNYGSPGLSRARPRCFRRRDAAREKVARPDDTFVSLPVACPSPTKLQKYRSSNDHLLIPAIVSRR